MEADIEEINIFTKQEVEKYSPGGIEVDLSKVKDVLSNCKDIVRSDLMMNDCDLDNHIYNEKRAIVMCQTLANEVSKLRKVANALKVMISARD